MNVEDVSYLDFDLLVERVGRRYRARVLSSPVGPTSSVEFARPITKQALQVFLLTVGQPRRAVRRIDTPVASEIKKLGGRLYRAVFQEQLRDCLIRSELEARRLGRGLRIRLHLDSPVMADLPWEYLYDEQKGSFLSLSRATPIVRYLEIDDSPAPLETTYPLRIIAVISSPRDYPRLDIEGEWHKLTQALGSLLSEGIVTIERLSPSTVEELQKILQGSPYHILHFIGHGGFREDTDEGILLLEDDFGDAHELSGEDLGILLQDHPSLRLVVLNACEGARGSTSDPFSGTAQSLIRKRVPAVVAMQFEITDTAAIEFSHFFYWALAANYSVDSAVAEARKAIRVGGNEVEWGTPVLYMIAPNGRIFALPDEETQRAQNLQPGAAEQGQVQAEQERVQEEQGQVQAEQGQVQAEQERVQEEQERLEAGRATHASTEGQDRSQADQQVARERIERKAQEAREREQRKAKAGIDDEAVGEVGPEEDWQEAAMQLPVPVAEVTSLLQDFEGYPKWLTAIKAASVTRKPTGTEPGGETEMSIRSRWGADTVFESGVVLLRSVPKGVEYRWSGKTAAVEGRFLVEARQGGSLVRHKVRVITLGLWSILRIPMLAELKKSVENDLKALSEWFDFRR